MIWRIYDFIHIVHVESKINFQKCLKSVLHTERCNDVHYAAAAQRKDIRPSNIDFSFPLPLAETNDSRSRGTSRLYFLASYNRPYRLSPRLSLSSCRAHDGRVLHSCLEPIPCRDTYAIGFLSKSWSDVYVCVRVRLEIAMIFEAFSAVWQPHTVCSTQFLPSLFYSSA